MDISRVGRASAGSDAQFRRHRTVWARVLAAVVGGVAAMPGGAYGDHRCWAEATLTFGRQPPAMVLMRCSCKPPDRLRVDAIRPAAHGGSALVSEYMRHAVYILNGGEFGAFSQGEPGRADLGAPDEGGRVGRAVGTGNFPRIAPYLRGMLYLSRLLASPPTTHAPGTAGGDPTVVTWETPDVLRPYEPHAFARYIYWVDAGRGVPTKGEIRRPDGELAATVLFGDERRLPGGGWAAFRVTLELEPGDVELGELTITSTQDGVTTSGKLEVAAPWPLRRIERTLQLVDGRYVLPRRTTAFDAGGRVIADILYSHYQVDIEINDEEFRMPDE